MVLALAIDADESALLCKFPSGHQLRLPAKISRWLTEFTFKCL